VAVVDAELIRILSERAFRIAHGLQVYVQLDSKFLQKLVTQTVAKTLDRKNQLIQHRKLLLDHYVLIVEVVESSINLRILGFEPLVCVLFGHVDYVNRIGFYQLISSTYLNKKAQTTQIYRSKFQQ